MPVITIAREYGSGGAEIGARLAAQLGAALVDRSLILEVAHRASLSPDQVEQEEEQGRSIVERMARAFIPLSDAGGWVPEPADLIDHHAVIVALTRAVLQEAARTGNAVIVGRGGAAELRDEPSAYHVFLWAPESDRVRTIQERLGCDAVSARAALHATDHRRAAYVREVYGVDWRDRALYDLILNTARLGHTGTAGAILGAIPRCLAAAATGSPPVARAPR